MIVIVDYGMGNLKSVQNAFAKVGYEAIITEDTYKINNASAIILPGVGAFGNAINTLRGKKIDRELIKAIKLNKPFLGICLGMQLAMIEFARNVLKIENANSVEFDENTPDPLIYLIDEFIDASG
ncbi:MAG: hypothetical protein KAH35_09105, partial [Candidatus Atribacteria bacterium]|nr:hypothetical protein [Candidatus Atribacteria bacterium]